MQHSTSPEHLLYITVLYKSRQNLHLQETRIHACFVLLLSVHIANQILIRAVLSLSLPFCCITYYQVVNPSIAVEVPSSLV